MTCSFFDIVCHGQSLAFGWWAALPWYAKLGIVVGIGFMIWGMVERAIFAVRKVGEWVYRIGGWPAVVGASIVAVTALVSIVVALLPKRRGELPSENVDGPDADPPPKKPKRKTLQDLFRDGLR